MNTFKRPSAILLLAGISLFFVSCSSAPPEKVGPWDLSVLYEVPPWETTDSASQEGMTGILYESLPYKGNPVQVFAYYNAPDGEAPVGGWPAVVCVHGGGGTAFHLWVQEWNERGFAAISMDLEGHFPLRSKGENRGPRLSTPAPGPSRVGVFGDYGLPMEEQWYYHAVSQAILAHSLLRSFPEVNPEKTGITGISWGGTLTSTIMGVDDRFKFAIPVYGCGYLPDSDGHQGDAIESGEQTRIVYTYFDGSAYFNNVSIPTLWVNGTNDKHFSMPATQLSSHAVQGPATLRYQPRMRHGHYPGWEPEEIYAFAKSVVQDGNPLIAFEVPEIQEDQARVAFSGTESPVRARLHFTRDTGIWNKRNWEETPVPVSGSTITASIPEGTTALFFTATDRRELMTSSEYIETK